MKKLNLIISIKTNQIKTVLFYIDKNNKIIIYEAHNSRLSLFKIKKFYNIYNIEQTLIVISNKLSYNINILQNKLQNYNIDTSLIIHEYFLISYILKNNNEKVNITLNQIPNGWMDLSDLEHIDLNSAIFYLYNLKSSKS